MSEGTQIILIICITAFVLTTMICATKIKLGEQRAVKPEDEARERYYETTDRVFRPTPAPVFEYSKTERRVPQEDSAEAAKPPLPLDPKNPPKTITFPMNEANPPRCVCHGERVQGGQRVVAWPDGEGYRFLCAEEGA